MLRSVRDVVGYGLSATDGEIGEIADLLVDDADLKVRYLVIDTGRWLPGRQVILSAAWISSVEPAKRTVVMNIDTKRIKEAPAYDPGAVIDRGYESRLHDHYRFPYYWI
ncbi:MAG TPA: PRC-barrel domain-containing protein [Methylomirabilota bacterium]|jgi:hypothetical protein|nr:PRC-barrel domain-containing protein [Methylomirabilota bacterium]